MGAIRAHARSASRFLANRDGSIQGFLKGCFGTFGDGQRRAICSCDRRVINFKRIRWRILRMVSARVGIASPDRKSANLATTCTRPGTRPPQRTKRSRRNRNRGHAKSETSITAIRNRRSRLVGIRRKAWMTGQIWPVNLIVRSRCRRCASRRCVNDGRQRVVDSAFGGPRIEDRLFHIRLRGACGAFLRLGGGCGLRMCTEAVRANAR